MFEHLRDPFPPDPHDATRQLVARRARQIRRRGQVGRTIAALAIVSTVIGAGVVTSHRSSGAPATLEVADDGRSCCGTIEATVRDSSGPLQGVTVSLLALGPTKPTKEDPSPWKVTARQTSDGTGHVTFSGIDAGTYAVRAEDHVDALLKKARHQPTFYASVPILGRATPLRVESNRTIPVDVVLELNPTTTVSGDVRESLQHFPISGITAKLFVDGELSRETTTDTNGSYDFGGVPSGTYTLEFVDNKGAERSIAVAYRSTWFADPGRPEGSFTSVPFDVSDGDVAANITLTR